MALREAAVHYRFAGGVETKTDAKAVPATKLLVLENGVFDRAISIRKRNGYEALGQAIDGSADLMDDAIRHAARGDELLAFTSNRCYSQMPDADAWSDAGAVFSAIGRDRPLVRTGTQQTAPDQATLAGVTVAAWEDSAGGVWWTAIDAVSGRVHRAATQADANGISPRCVVSGGNLHVYYALAASGRVMVVVVNPASPSSAVTPVILIDDLSTTNPVYDACPTTRGDAAAAIAWLENGTTDIRIGYVTPGGAIGSILSGFPSVITYTAARDASTPLGVSHVSSAPGITDGDADILAIAYVTAASSGRTVTFKGGDEFEPIFLIADIATYAATSVQRVAIVLVNGSAERTVGTAWEEAAAAASNRFTVAVIVDLASSTVSTPVTIRSVGLASRAFAINRDSFATFVHDTTYFNTYVTLRLSDATPVGRHVPAGAAGAPAHKHQPSAHVVDDVASIALPVRTRLVSENDDKFTETGIRLVSMDFDSEDSHQYAQLGAGLYLAGACPMHYDGRIWTEQGFHFGPEVIVATPAGGGSMTASTTYEYRAWYEWPDAQGEVHRGPVSIGTLVTMAGGQTQVTLTLPTLRVTRKPNVRINVARSLAGKTGDTAQMFRVTSLDPTTAGSANGYVGNDTSVDTVSFLDRMSDADLRLQEPIYTTGGVLSNDPCPLGSVIAGGKSRLLTTDPSDGNIVRFSQLLVDGYGVEFAPELFHPVDPFGGDITALASRDDRYFVFKANAIFTFTGDGPLETGDTSTSGFTTPQLLPGDVGCTDPSSIVLTPQGHIFQSSRGKWRINNDGSLEYVGAPVEAYNAQRTRRATVLPDRTQVLFLTDSGLGLLYDYLFGQWSTFTNHEGRDAVVVRGVYHYLRNDGRVFRETVGAYSDAGVRIRLRLETAWIHLYEQLQGFQVFWHMVLLGTWVSPHQLGIQYQTDYTPGWNDMLWYDATGLSSSAGWITGSTAIPIGTEPITGTEYGEGLYGDGEYGGDPLGLYQWRLDLHERGQSIQFRFEDFEADGYNGGSFELTELLMTGGAVGNAPRPFSAGRGF